MTFIRPINSDDLAIYRDVRLRALVDSPSAFGSTHARESAFNDDEWTQRVRNATNSTTGVCFLAFDDTICRGLIGCFRDREDAARAWIVSMWVAPEARRRGVGATLMHAAEDWAKANGYRELLLDVTEGNDPAIALYQHRGFSFTGRIKPHPHQAELRELEMAKSM